MARTKTSPDTAPSAAHAAPAPGTAPAADTPAAAIHAALSANPGSTVAAIADAAETGKAAARDALLAMEKAGTATRVKGGRPGIPDTWTLADARQDDADPAPDPAHGQDGPLADHPDGSPDGPGGDREGEAAPDVTAGTAVPVTQDDEEAVPDVGPQDPDSDATDSDGEAGDAPDPALIKDVTQGIIRIRAAADAAGLVLAGAGDLRAALAGLDEIGELAAQGRRSLKAAIGGRKAPAARPGGLRERVLAHLVAYPDGEFTPHEIHKVLGNSSGAIANALDVLVGRGEAQLAVEKPRRYRRAPCLAPAAEPGSAEDDGAELAGAA